MARRLKILVVADSTYLSFSAVKDNRDYLSRYRDLGIGVPSGVIHI
jgi:hypothetical protein